MISKNEAIDIITAIRDDDFSNGRKPETWYTYHNHVFGTAALSFEIAKRLKYLDADRAYVMGLLHDTGKIKGDRDKRFHGIVGYELLKEIDALCAKTSMLHTFPFNVLLPDSDYLFLGNDDDFEFTKKYLKQTEYDDYDLLIQMCDNMAYIRGFVTIEKRLSDWGKRNNREIIPEHINPLLELKSYFGEKIGTDIYSIFADIDKSYLID